MGTANNILDFEKTPDAMLSDMYYDVYLTSSGSKVIDFNYDGTTKKATVEEEEITDNAGNTYYDVINISRALSIHFELLEDYKKFKGAVVIKGGGGYEYSNIYGESGVIQAGQTWFKIYNENGGCVV